MQGWVGHVGVGWVMQGWGGSCRGRVGSCRGRIGHAGVGWGGSYWVKWGK